MLGYFNSLAQSFRVANNAIQPESQLYGNIQTRFAISDSKNKEIDSYSKLGSYDGSPYIFESNYPVHIVDIYGERFNSQYFNIDAYMDQFILSKKPSMEEEEYIWLQKEEIRYVIVVDLSNMSIPKERYFKYVKSKVDEEPIGICEVIYNDSKSGIQVISKNDVTLVRARPATNGISADVPAKFRKNRNYYILDEATGLIAIKKEKDFHNLFGDDKKNVKRLMKEGNLDYRNPKHLEEIFKLFSIAS